MTRKLSTRRNAILGALLLVLLATGLWWFGSVKSAKGVSVRFLGYTEGKPYATAPSGPSLAAVFGVNVSIVATDQTMRVAQFAISNGNDFPVSCGWVVNYTNRVGAFVPGSFNLAAHTATNVIGVAVPPSATGTSVGAPAPNWTEPWRLRGWVTEATPQFQGIRASREKAMVWLFAHKYYRLGTFMNPRSVERVLTDLIPPDSEAKP